MNRESVHQIAVAMLPLSLGVSMGLASAPGGGSYYSRSSSASTYRLSPDSSSLNRQIKSLGNAENNQSISNRPSLTTSTLSTNSMSKLNSIKSDVELVQLKNTDVYKIATESNTFNEIELKTLQPVKELVIIDASVKDKHVFYDMSRPGIDVVEIEFTKDSLTQLSNELLKHKNLDAFHLVSHAKNGVIYLGKQAITEIDLKNHVRALASIDHALKEKGDVLIYGCELASGTAGESLLELVANKANVDVAASNNTTGARELRGDWELEVVKGDIKTDNPFSKRSLKDFSSVLAIPGTIEFTVGTNSGTYGGASTVNASYTNNGYTIIADGADVGTYIPAVTDRVYVGAFGSNESELALYFSGNEIFNATSLYIYNSSGGALSFTVTSDVGGDSVTTSFLGGGTGTTVNLTGFDAITKLYVTPSSASYWAVDNLVMDFNVNTAPVISVDNSTLAFTEGDGVTQIDSAATISDADGDADWNGGTLVAQITANNEAADQLSIPDNVVGSINTSGTNLLNGGTVIGTLSASEGTVTNGTALTITFDSDATNSLVQQTLRAIHYNNTSSTPGTSNRTVTFTATDTNTDSANDTRTISVDDTSDSDGSLTAAGGVSEPVGLNTTVDSVGEAVDVFDFTLSDGGTSDGLTMTVSEVAVNVSGTTTDTQRDNIIWRLNGNDVSNVTGFYNAIADTITFPGLSISIADGGSEIYTVNAYYNDNTGVTEDNTFILSVDGDTDLTVGGAGTQMGSTSAITNGSGGTLDVTASALAFTTQPAGSVSGGALTTQPVVTAQDAFGNTDVDFTETIALTESSAGTLTNATQSAVSGVATFTNVTYTATADQQSFILTANDQDGVGSDLSTTDANSVTSDVVATLLLFDSQPAPLSVNSGIATNFTTVPVVSARDAIGVVDTGYSTDITLVEVNGAGSATMSGTGDTDGNGATVSITPSSGVSTFSNMQITYTASGGSSENFNLQASSGGLSTVNSNQLTAQVQDNDGSLISAAGVIEPVGLATTVDTIGEAVNVFDFTLSDGGTADGMAMTVSQVVVNVSGTTSDVTRNKVNWQLNGPDVSNVTGTYNAGSDTITFTGLSISIADAASEIYTLSGYYNDNTGLTEDQTFVFSVDGDSDLTVGSSGTQMGVTSAVTNGTGSTIDVTASILAFITQPAGSVSGNTLTTQPAVTAQDAFGNTDTDFTETITVTEASSGSLSNGSVSASSGVATFTNVIYTATADQQSFTLTANDQDGVGSNLSTVDSNAVTSDVVATTLVYQTQPAPLSVNSGEATNFTTVPVVSAQDANGVVDTGYSTDISLAEVNGAGTATMSGTGDTDGNGATVSITPSSGVSTFTGLQITYTASGGSNENFNLQASSGGLTSVNSNQITGVVNTAPSITSTAITTATEDSGYSYTLTATDADSDPLTFSAPTLPSWLSFNAGTGALTGTPTNDEVGNHNVTLRVNDGTVDVDQSFTITVSNINDAPVVTSTAVTAATEDAAYSYTFTATDDDSGDTLTLSAPTLPSWLSFNAGTGALTGTPTNDEVGNHNVTLRVNDGTVDVDQSFTITVNGVNDLPTGEVIINGTPVRNETLTAETSSIVDEDGLGAFSYQWQRSSSNISGATGSSYLLGDDDVGQTIRVVVSYTDGGGTEETLISDATESIADLDSDGDGIPDLVEGTGDTDGDGIPDYLDEDSDGDGIPDSEEGTSDSDGDAIPDYLDSSPDEDGDGIPDVMDGNANIDTDGDGEADVFDTDSDNDGIPDFNESNASGLDTDGDGIDDAFDVDQTGGTDSNGDGIDDAALVDTDSDGIADAYDRDSDNDLVPDALENELGLALRQNIDLSRLLMEMTSDFDGDGVEDYRDNDSDQDGITDRAESLVSDTDSDGDQIVDAFDVDITSGTDANLDGIDDNVSLQNSDNDQSPDMFDLDSDNDGLSDVTEAGFNDTDQNALLDEADVATDTPQSTDNDDIPDYLDRDSDDDGTFDILSGGGASLDIDGDGQIDNATDTDGDGLVDSVDEEQNQFGNAPDRDGDGIASSTDRDDDGDGIADVVEGTLDNDQDGLINANDRDSDGDGLTDQFEANRPAPLGQDADSDGIDDRYDVDFAGGNDANGDGISDAFSVVDTDGDGQPDYLDTDSDNDGISDLREQINVVLSGQDTDGDGLDDAIDVDQTSGVDANGDGMDDSVFINDDIDGDGVLAFRDLDTDGDGILDANEDGDFNNDGIDDRIQAEIKVEPTFSSGSSSFILLFMLMILATLRNSVKARLILALIATSLFSFKLNASENNACISGKESKNMCWYIGMGIGASKFNLLTENTNWQITDDSSTASKLTLGLDLGHDWFSELNYSRLGNAKLESVNPSLQNTGNIRYDMSSLAVGYRLRVKQYGSLNIKAGWAGMHATSNFIPTENDDFFMWGIGGRWPVGEYGQAFQVEYERFKDDISVMSLSFVKYF